MRCLRGVTALGTYSPVTLINFTIDESAYQAEEGMTWGEWVASSYNTGRTNGDNVVKKFYITSDSDVGWENGLVSIENTVMNESTVIVNNTSYELHGGGYFQ